MAGGFFVGRQRELARLAALLEPSGPHVHSIHAPGGVGKTTLARAFGRQAKEAGFAVAWADAALVDVTPAALRAAWMRSLEVTSLESLSDKTLLVLDNFEAVGGLEGWLRERVMPTAGPRARLLLVGRQPASALWTTDPEWIGRIQVSRLACWDREEAELYLTKRGVDAPARTAAIAASHGHPLALALLADVSQRQAGHASLGWAEHPSLVSVVVEKLCGTIEEPLRRRAMAVTAEARVTTQSLLEALLEIDDGYALFHWLRSLSFMQAHPEGLVPHDLVRDVVGYELAWRDPSRAHALTESFRSYYLGRFDAAPDRQTELDVLRDLAFLHRRQPMAREMFAFQPARVLCPDAGVADDLPAVEAMLASHGLAASMRWVRYWFERQPASLVLMRDASGALAGMELALRVDEETLAAAEGEDPAAAPLRAALAQRESPRAGEHSIVGRLWCTEHGQTVNDVQSQLWLNRLRECVRNPGLAHVVACFFDVQAWTPPLTYMGFERAPDADFEDDSGAQGAFIRDWRRESPAEWFLRMAQLATAKEPQVHKPGPARTAVVLSEAAFADAVKAALRDYPSREALATNPLANSRLVSQRVVAPNPDRAELLAQLLEEACDAVRVAPSTKKAYRALFRTFVNPAGTQREAAALESMPFGTFRRHLSVGIERVTEYLWRLETSDTPLSAN